MVRFSSVNCAILTSSLLLPVGLLTFGITNPSDAAIINSGFETGDFTGWSTIGNTSIQTTGFGSGPTEGSKEALVTNGSGSVTESELETFLELDPSKAPLFFLGNGTPTTGSAIKQEFTANAGQTLTFDWNFLTNETGDSINNDFAFVSLNSLGTLSSEVTSSFIPFSSTFAQQTGFKTSTLSIPTTGTYTLGLGVINVNDALVDSGLLVDNVSLQAVPEPTSVLGTLALGTLVVGTLLKRK